MTAGGEESMLARKSNVKSDCALAGRVSRGRCGGACQCVVERLDERPEHLDAERAIFAGSEISRWKMHRLWL